VLPPDSELFELSSRVGKALTERRQTLAVAESCTGGLLGATITDVPGSSAYFLGGVISYANSVKVELLAVPEETIRTEGAVSAAAARAMAEGVRLLLRADLGLSITGVAGPAAEESKPAGLTFIGLSGPSSEARRWQWSGDRWENRRRSVMAALELLAERLNV
jgi:nicotinamide-nucleotide amidase